MRSRSSALLVLAVVCATSFAQSDRSSGAEAPSAVDAHYVPVLKFDPKRDAAADIRAAITEAQRTGKRILLDVGGDWCTWCHVLDEFFAQHPDIVHIRDANFVTVAIFYSDENKNEKVLSSYPKPEGIPHIFVLDQDGTYLYSQGMVKLETGGEPDPEKIKSFLRTWSRHPNPASIK